MVTAIVALCVLSVAANVAAMATGSLRLAAVGLALWGSATFLIFRAA